MNSNAQDDKYVVALLIVCGGIVVFSVLLVLTAVQIVRPALLRSLAARAQPTKASAALVVPGEFAQDFSISTMVNVPLPPGVHTEPSLQFNAYDGTDSWEAGLIRAKKYGYRLASFVADGSRTRRYRLLYLPPLSGGPHRIGLSRSGSTLRFFIDDRPAYTFADAPVPRSAMLRLAIATAIGRSGELASGSFWDVRIRQSVDQSGESHDPRCSVSWGGVALIPIGSRWVLEGRSDPAELGHRVAHCRTES